MDDGSRFGGHAANEGRSRDPGKFFGGTQASVQFETNGKIELYNLDDIISVTFTGAPPASSLPPVAAFGPTCFRYTSTRAKGVTGQPPAKLLRQMNRITVQAGTICLFE